MKTNLKNSKRVICAVLTAAFIIQQSMFVSAMATNITNVTGNNGVYNIDPTAIIKNTDIGLRKYENFDLSAGDIANLIYKYGDKNINSFVNLVDNTIKINGIVNTMRDGNFYNGRAIFVSPNGMVVGASGVLNVGSLGVYTPNTDVYNRFKNNPSNDLSVLKSKDNVGNGAVKIDGHVFAANDVDVVSSLIQVPGKVVAGTGINTTFGSNSRADQLFNTLVNTSNINYASQISTRNGNISFTSTKGNEIAGNVQNFGTGNTNITNHGDLGTRITGKVVNHNGNLNITNNAGGVFGSNTAKVENRGGDLRIVNNGSGIYFVKDSQIVSDKNLYISNTGAKGAVIDANVSSNGTSVVDNKSDVLTIGGNYKNNGDTTIINSGTQLTISGNMTNTNGKLTLDNSGDKWLYQTSTSEINSQGIEIKNTGKQGIVLGGKVNNEGTALVTNAPQGVKGVFVQGSFNNNGNAKFENSEKGGLNVTGSLTNKNGQLVMNNSGEYGLNVSKNGIIDAQGLSMTNNGANGTNIHGKVLNQGNGSFTNNAGALKVYETAYMSNKNGTATYENKGNNGLIIAGEVDNEGTTIAQNHAGAISVLGKFSNAGDSSFTNSGTQINVSGTIDNDGKLSFDNHGDKGLNIVATGVVKSKGLSAKNDGAAGIKMYGRMSNIGSGEIINSGNTKEGIKIAGILENNNGVLAVKNYGGGGLEVFKGGKVISNNLNKNSLVMDNTGADGLVVKGEVNTLGSAKYNNTGANGLKIYGKTHTVNGNATFTNTAGGLNVYGETRNTVGVTTMTNSGEIGINQDKNGVIFADNAYITNTGKNGINLYGRTFIGATGNIKNSGTNGLNVYGNIEHGIVDSHAPSGKLTLANDGYYGLNVKGRVHSYNDVDVISGANARNGVNIYGNITNERGNLNITNDGMIGINVREGGSINTNNLKMTNNGANGTHVKGIVNNKGTMDIVNNQGWVKVHESGVINNNGDLNISNKGQYGLVIAGKLNNSGTATLINEAGPVSILGSFKNNGNTTIQNSASQINVSGNVENRNGLLKMNNSGEKGFNVMSTGTVTSEGIQVTNTGKGGVAIAGKINNTGAAEILNNIEGEGGLNVYGAIENKDGNLQLVNTGDNGLNVFGTVTNANGKTTFTNNGKVKGINIVNNALIKTQGLEMVNNAQKGLVVWGTVENEGNASYTNNGNYFSIEKGAKVTNRNGDVNYYNKGEHGFVVAGTVDNDGAAVVKNENGPLSIPGTFSNKGNLQLLNNGRQINISGNVASQEDVLLNNTGSQGVNVIRTGNVAAKNVNIVNTGTNGVHIDGKVNSSNDVNITNKGTSATIVNTNASVKAGHDINIDDSSKGGVFDAGQIYADNDIKISSNGGNVLIGSNEPQNDNYIYAKRDVNIKVVDGSIKNFGTKKTLINAGNNAKISVTNGEIGKTDTLVNKDEKDNKTTSLNVRIGNNYEEEAVK